MRLKDKVAFVTGGGRGIGRITALTFAREGARVAVADINGEAAEAVAAELREGGANAMGVQVDVSQSASVEAAINAVAEWGGGIDIQVNNAGITRDARMQKMSEDQWDSVISVNLKGVWLCARTVAPIMVSQGGGCILSTSSIVAHYGNFGQTNYVATKAGVIGMTKTWARELGPSGIRVNAVAPGFTATEMIQTVPQKVIDAIKDRTPMRRLGEPEDIANTFLFLASDEATFITGQVISVDGGLIV
ncbi:MAG: 3-oxoacyl-ACP reductase FabG [Chloroflexaceae bacterium]